MKTWISEGLVALRDVWKIKIHKDNVVKKKEKEMPTCVLCNRKKIIQQKR